MPDYNLEIYSGVYGKPAIENHRDNYIENIINRQDFWYQNYGIGCRESLLSYLNTFTSAYEVLASRITKGIFVKIDILNYKPNLSSENQKILNSYFKKLCRTGTDIIYGPNTILYRFGGYVDDIFVSLVLWILTDRKLTALALAGDTDALVEYILNDYDEDHISDDDDDGGYYITNEDGDEEWVDSGVDDNDLPPNPLSSTEQFMYGFYIDFCSKEGAPKRNFVGYSNGPGSYGELLAGLYPQWFIKFINKYKKEAKNIANSYRYGYSISTSWEYILTKEIKNG